MDSNPVNLVNPVENTSGFCTIAGLTPRRKVPNDRENPKDFRDFAQELSGGSNIGQMGLDGAERAG